MNIKKVDDKPMVIHTKEKTKIHVKSAPETKIKGRNVLVVDRSPKIAGADKELKADKADKRLSALKIKSAGKNHKGTGKEPDKNAPSVKGSTKAKKETGKPVQKESGVYAQFQRTKQDRERAVGKKNSTAHSVASVGAMTALDQVEGGNEVYESYMVAKTITAPVVGAADAGRRLYLSQAARTQAKKIKKVQAGKKIGKKMVRDSAAKTARYSAKKVAKEAAKETAKTAAKETAKATAKVVTTTAATAAGTAISPDVGTAIGAAAGYAAGAAVEYKDMQVTNRNRKLKFFLDKLNAEEQQKDSFAKLVKDLVLRSHYAC